MVARPAMVPVTVPIRLGLPKRTHSMTIQTSEAVAAEIWVTSIAMPALWSAARAEPALKPNQPTHSMAAPIMVMPGLCGGLTSPGNPLRPPSAMAMTRAETPAVV